MLRIQAVLHPVSPEWLSRTQIPNSQCFACRTKHTLPCDIGIAVCFHGGAQVKRDMCRYPLDVITFTCTIRVLDYARDDKFPDPHTI